MKVAVIGTGVVGKALASALARSGHQVVMGTRDPQSTLARTDKDMAGGPPIAEWLPQNPAVSLATLAEAAAGAELVVNATKGEESIAALRACGDLSGKVILDISNPLDFSKGFPPRLSICNDDSLGEQIQRALPTARVVKSLNTTNAFLMVTPGALAGGDHTMFVCGDDAEAKAVVRALLVEGFGWKDVIDLGDIAQARATEMLLPIWVRLYGNLQTPMFQFKIVR